MHSRCSCILSMLSKKKDYVNMARGSEDRESFVSSRRASTIFSLGFSVVSVFVVFCFAASDIFWHARNEREEWKCPTTSSRQF